MRLTLDMQKRNLAIGGRVMDLSQPDAIIQKSESRQYLRKHQSVRVKRFLANQTHRLSPAELHSCRIAYDIAFNAAGGQLIRHKCLRYYCQCCVIGLPALLLHMRGLMNRARSEHLRPSFTHPPPKRALAA